MAALFIDSLKSLSERIQQTQTLDMGFRQCQHFIYASDLTRDLLVGDKTSTNNTDNESFYVDKTIDMLIILRTYALQVRDCSLSSYPTVL